MNADDVDDRVRAAASITDVDLKQSSVADPLAALGRSILKLQADDQPDSQLDTVHETSDRSAISWFSSNPLRVAAASLLLVGVAALFATGFGRESNDEVVVAAGQPAEPWYAQESPGPYGTEDEPAYLDDSGVLLPGEITAGDCIVRVRVYNASQVAKIASETSQAIRVTVDNAAALTGSPAEPRNAPSWDGGVAWLIGPQAGCVDPELLGLPYPTVVAHGPLIDSWAGLGLSNDFQPLMDDPSNTIIVVLGSRFQDLNVFEPLPEGVPATGDWLTREQQLTISMAESALLADCMAEQGFTLFKPTETELIRHFGSWSPNGVLGIGAAGAARSIGYHDAGWGGAGSPSMAAAWHGLSQTEQDDHYQALSTRCWQIADIALSQVSNGLQETADSSQGERFRSDPILAAAIGQWQRCIKDRLEIDADTPNTLAREFAFSETSERELQVAVVDVQCQAETYLKEAFHRARTRQLRTELNVTAFDAQAIAAIRTHQLAEEVLADKQIEPPTLD